MRAPARVLFGAGAVGAIALVVGLGALFGPASARLWLVLTGALAVVAAVQSLIATPRDLSLALVLAVPSVVALGAEGAPTWLVAPLGGLLLLAGELQTLSWENRVSWPPTAVQRGRRARAAVLVLLGLGGAGGVYGIGTAFGLALPGTLAVAAAAVAFVLASHIVLRPATGRV